MADLYSTLGIKKEASEAEIKAAYRKLAKQLHPDRNKDNPKAAERFKTVSAANTILSDPDKRAQYDRGEIDESGNPKMPAGFAGRGGGGFQGFRAGGPGGAGATSTFEFGGDPSDLFAELFGRAQRSAGGAAGAAGAGPIDGGFRTAAKGADRAYKLAVPFEEAARLAPQRVQLANGKTLDVKLPAGFESGTQMRLAGQGDAGPGGAGDALVTLDIEPHAHFTREGDDVRLNLPVRLSEAVLGGKVRVPTVDGSVTLTVPAGSTSGRVLRLRGKGFTAKGGARGDQRVTVFVDIPGDDPELRAFVEGWTADRERNPRAALGVE